MKRQANFYQQVYELVAQIPFGRVTSYGAIARYLGAASSARLVGTALKSSLGLGIPAHRVLNRRGELTGKHAFGGSQIMEQLLRAEGLKVEKDRVQDWDTYFWDPNEELRRP